MSNNVKKTGRVLADLSQKPLPVPVQVPAVVPQPSNHTAFGAIALELAKMPKQLKAGCIRLANACGDELLALRKRCDGTSGKKGDSVRDACLNYWYATPEGEAHQQERKSIPGDVKLRSDLQKTRVPELKNIENNVSLQIQRAMDAYMGISVLKTQGRTVGIFETAKGSGVWGCYVRKPDEPQNFEFNAAALTALPKVVKSFTADTATQAVLALVSTGRKGKAGKKKGGKVVRLDNAKLAEAFAVLDTSVAAYTKDDGTLSAGKDGIAAGLRLYARLHHSYTAEQREAALAAFDEEGKAHKAKVKTPKGKVSAAA